MKAWCPIENDDLPADGEYAMLSETKDFTVFVKNHVYFPHYKKTRSNMIEMIDKKYLRSCRYHHIDAPYCPIFRLADIVSIASTKSGGEIEYNDKWYEEMAIKGGVISIGIKWDCNFDYNETQCKPEYVFDRLDNYEGNTIATGYNFRYPIFFQDEGRAIRQLVKAYGILFTLDTEASARKFDVVTFFRNIGSGLALLGIASVCCDIFLLYIHRKKEYFKNHIFIDVNRPELQQKHELIARESKSGSSRNSSSLFEVDSGDVHKGETNDVVHKNGNVNNHNNDPLEMAPLATSDY